MQFEGLFIDMYGTLTGGDRAAVEAVCHELIADARLRVTPRQFSVEWGNRFFKMVDNLDGAQFMTLYDIEAVSLVDTVKRYGVEIDARPYITQLSEYWRDPGIQPDTLRFFAECPVPICLVSNADSRDVDVAMARLGLQPAHVVTSEDARSYKPAPRIFDVALQLTGWARDRVIHVGDSIHSDVGGAQAAGVRSGWLNRACRIHDIGVHEPDHEFADLDEVLAFLKQH